MLQSIYSDLVQESQGVEFFYLLDFCEIHSYLFPMNSSQQVVSTIRYYFDNFKHQMILSPPTVWEFIQHLHGLSTWLREVCHPSATLIDEFLESSELKSFQEMLKDNPSADAILQAYNRMGKYRRIIDFMREDAVRVVLEEPAQNFVLHLEEGKLIILEDLLGPFDWQTLDTGVFQDTLENFDLKRPAIEKRVPNRIDALNLTMAFALNDQYSQDTARRKHFSIVTHGLATQQVYTKIRWPRRPLGKDMEGSSLARDHQHCAWHAYFENLGEPVTIIRENLQTLTELDDIKIEFEKLFQEFGRDSIEKWRDNNRDIEKALVQIKERLELLQQQLGVVAQPTPESSALEPLNINSNLLGILQNRSSIRARLTEHIPAANSAVKMVFEHVEPMLKEFPIKLIDYEFGKVIGGIENPSRETIPPDYEEHVSIRARLKPGLRDKPLEVGKEYSLYADVSWDKPGLDESQCQKMSMLFQIRVRSTKLEIIPLDFKDLEVHPEGKYYTSTFSIKATQAGQADATVEFYYRLNLVGEISLEFPIVDNSQPAYTTDPSRSITDEKRPAPPPGCADQVDVSITIKHLSNEAYEGLIVNRGQSVSFLIDVATHELDAISADIQQEARTFARYGRLSSEDQRDTLMKLVESGKCAYQKIFPESVQPFLAKCLEGEGKTVQINSNRFQLPWELLYSEDPRKPDIGKFWGMKYIISRAITKGRLEGIYALPQMMLSEKPKVGLMSDKSLPMVVSTEIPFFEELARQECIHLSHLHPLDSSQENWIDEFLDFWKDEFQLAHFACHAFVEEDRPLSTCFQISNRCQISIRKLEAYNFHAYNNPLVILNACHTGLVSPLHSFDLARTFLTNGARGVLATECDISDAKAAKFVGFLFFYLVQLRKSLGESLWLTRRGFWAKFADPVGLFYALYARASIRFEMDSTRPLLTSEN